MTAVISTRGLVKQYGRLRAVDGIDLEVRAGDVYGFLGANGSGKTTTVRMLLGLVLATSGTAEVLERPMPRDGGQVLPHVGALVESPAAYPRLSGRANLRVHDALGRSGRSGRRPTPASPTCSSAASTRRRRVRHAPPRPEASSSDRFSRPDRCP